MVKHTKKKRFSPHDFKSMFLILEIMNTSIQFANHLLQGQGDLDRII